MPKYFVFNPGPNTAVELKPGIGEFRIGPDKRVEIPTKELAQSLVVDSGGHLRLEIVEYPSEVAAVVESIESTKTPKSFGGIESLNSTKEKFPELVEGE